MRFVNTLLEFVAFDLPALSSIASSFQLDDTILDHRVGSDDDWTQFDLSSARNNSLLRVTAYSFDHPDAVRLIEHLTRQIDVLPTSEGKDAVKQHLESTDYILENHDVRRGTNGHAWDIEYVLNCCLAQLTTPSALMSFCNDGSKSEFADDVCTHLSFDDPSLATISTEQRDAPESSS